ncbi:MAG: Nucleoid occlusion factor SlmA [Phycisphaerae bacterium]|nr:Nucleoid occlusion factor SlmA [Phycisphaerae bacterium]
MAKHRMKAEDRRQQIMEVAQRLFARLGYNQTTTAAIAKAAGVTEPILYRHFRSKRDLFLTLLESLTNEVIAQMQALVQAQGDDPLAQLRAICVTYPQLTAQFAEPFAMINRALASLGGSAKGKRGLPDVRPLLARHYEAYETLALDIIRRGQKSGSFRGDLDPQLAAWFLIQVAIGHTMARNLDPAVFKKKFFVNQSLEAIIHGLVGSR